MLGIVEDRLSRHPQLGLGGDRPAGVRIAGKSREVAAADLDANPVAGLEQIARGLQVDPVFADRAGVEQLRPIRAMAIARPRDAVGQAEGAAVCVNIDQLDGPVGVRRRGGREQD
jgi:hypothetical protein